MSMTPESPLFGQYETHLDEQIAELAFAQRMNAALDTVDAYDTRVRDTRLMLDSRAIGNLVVGSALPDATQIGYSIHADSERGNTDNRPTPANISPGFDEIERGGVKCTTYVAKLQPPSYGTAYTVYRLVIAPSEQKTLPDGRGYYIARGEQDKTITIFHVRGESYAGRAAALKPGDAYIPRLEAVTAKDRRLAVLDELEKAATAINGLPPEPRRRWQ